MDNTETKIRLAIEYLGADTPVNETYTISASILRQLGRNAAVCKRLNGGRYVGGITSDGKFLPRIEGGSQNAMLTIRAAISADEQQKLLKVLRAAVASAHPAGSAYDPAVRPVWDAWRALLQDLSIN